MPAFALCEIMVRQAWTGRASPTLCTTSFSTTAPRAVRAAGQHTKAYRAYLHWGWRKVGETQPYLPDAPCSKSGATDL
jgi:hypothetical protein